MLHLVVRTDGRTIDIEDSGSRAELITGLPFSPAVFGALLQRVRILNSDPFVATADDARLALRGRAAFPALPVRTPRTTGPRAARTARAARS